MRKSFVVLSAVLVVGLNISLADDSMNEVSSQSIVPINQIFVPKGQIFGEAAEVVVSGYLPNLCYSNPTITVEKTGNVIELTAMANEVHNRACLQAIVPFQHTIDLGKLERGVYQIVYANGMSFEGSDNKMDGGLQEIEVGDESANLAEGEELAYIDNVRQEGSELFLDGYDMGFCFSLDRIEKISDGENVVTLLPIMRPKWDSCPLKMTGFTRQVDIKELSLKQRTLIHVRAAQGKQINLLYIPL